MKILALSDLYWTQKSKSINIDDVQKMSFNQILNSPNLSCVNNYFKIIKALEPNLVLFCGDITGDGFCGTGFSSAIISLLRLIEISKINARYISGNHDLPEFYNQINDFFHSSKYIKELTLHPEDIDGFLFAGLSYNQSRNYTEFRKNIFYDKIDFLVAHCIQSQRLNLFEFNTDYIITGHFDLKVINPDNKIFISLDNDRYEISGKSFAFIYHNRDFGFIKMISPSKTPHNKYIDNSFKVKNNKLTLASTNFDKESAMEKAIRMRFKSPIDCNYYINNIEYQNVIEKVVQYKKLGQAVSQQELKGFLSVNINFILKVSKVFLNKHICLDNSFDVCTNDILNDWV